MWFLYLLFHMYIYKIIFFDKTIYPTFLNIICILYVIICSVGSCHYLSQQVQFGSLSSNLTSMIGHEQTSLVHMPAVDICVRLLMVFQMKPSCEGYADESLVKMYNSPSSITMYSDPVSFRFPVFRIVWWIHVLPLVVSLLFSLLFNFIINCLINTL